jgi:[acyl-carrier-protein] S-malonyltransferase
LMKKAGERNPGKMAAILTLDDEQVADICAQVSAETAWVQVANYNNPGQVVISGEEAGIDRAIELAKAAGARRAQKLPISIAAHSKLMAVIGDEFKAAVNAVTLSKPKVPIVANITARPLISVEAIRDEMVGQLTASVQWTQSIRYMIEQGITQFIEVGSKNVLCGMIRRIDRSVSAISIENLAGINKVVEAQA